MKLRLALSLILGWSAVTFGQEDPWLPKGNDPWAAYKNEVDTSSTKNLVGQFADKDTLASDSSTFRENEVAVISGIEKPVYLNATGDLDKSGRELLREDLKQYADTSFKASGYFVVGMFTGLTLGVLALSADAITVIPDTRAERAIQKAVEEDPRFREIPEEKLKKERRSATNKKQFRKALLGSAVGISIRLLWIASRLNILS